MAARGEFLSDLAFRFTAVRLKVLPLRERREDIVPLATLFLDRIRARYRVPGFSIAPAAVSRLLQHDWLGNVGELSSVLECAVLECTNGIIREEDLCMNSAPARLQTSLKTTQILTLDAVIQNHLRYVLELNHGNKLKTARQLGISRSTLYRLLTPGTLS
jgi:DNA-binding NtrC family response regulator